MSAADSGDLFDVKPPPPMPPVAGVWHVGTSGFEFDDWRGTVYPAHLAGRGLLAHYLNEFKFNALELNWTFYHMPGAHALESFAARTPSQYALALKIHGSITHERGQRAPEAACAAFNDAVKPLRDAGKLAALLFQFPFAFKNNAANRAYVEQCRSCFPGDPVAIEFRHASWLLPETDQWLGSIGCAYCCVDEPALEGLMPLHAARTAPFVYARLHGRNPNWFTAGEKERYNYDYRDAELRSILDTIACAAKGAKKMLVFFNNCHMGRAVKNAMTFRAMLEEHAG